MIAIPCQNILDIVSYGFSTKTAHVFNLMNGTMKQQWIERNLLEKWCPKIRGLFKDAIINILRQSGLSGNTLDWAKTSLLNALNKMCYLLPYHQIFYRLRASFERLQALQHFPFAWNFLLLLRNFLQRDFISAIVLVFVWCQSAETAHGLKTLKNHKVIELRIWHFTQQIV